MIIDKYLSKLISSLRNPEHTLSSIKEFIQNVQTAKVATGYHMVSFDVKSLLTNFSLEYTIDLVFIIMENFEWILQDQK